jgi:hypothetical protein
MRIPAVLITGSGTAGHDHLLVVVITGNCRPTLDVARHKFMAAKQSLFLIGIEVQL